MNADARQACMATKLPTLINRTVKLCPRWWGQCNCWSLKLLASIPSLSWCINTITQYKIAQPFFSVALQCWLCELFLKWLLGVGNILCVVNIISLYLLNLFRSLTSLITLWSTPPLAPVSETEIIDPLSRIILIRNPAVKPSWKQSP